MFPLLLSKKTKSPASASEIKSMVLPCSDCWCASLYSLIPHNLNTICVKPEQSIPKGVLPHP